MPSRKMLLQIMLWCLGLGAAAGVLAVLIAASDVVYRVMWTAFLAALAAALLMPTSRGGAGRRGGTARQRFPRSTFSHIGS